MMRTRPEVRHRWSIGSTNYPEVPNEPTMWERFLLAEGLEEDHLPHNNPKVMLFIMKNAQRFYVPTKVLKLYGAYFHDA